MKKTTKLSIFRKEFKNNAHILTKYQSVFSFLKSKKKKKKKTKGIRFFSSAINKNEEKMGKCQYPFIYPILTYIYTAVVQYIKFYCPNGSSSN